MKTFSLEDYNKLVKDIKVANQRIQKIQNRYGEESWAINELYKNIDNRFIKAVSGKTGGIRIDKSMTDVQLRMVQKATDMFLHEYKTSSLVGIRHAIADTKKSLQATYGEQFKEITDKEVNFLYDLVEDKNKRDLTENIGASEVWAKLIQAKEQKLKLSEFRDLFKDVDNVDLKEKDTREYLREIYYKYKKQ